MEPPKKHDLEEELSQAAMQKSEPLLCTLFF